MCKNCSNKEVLVFQFDTVMKYLESHSKQYDIDTGAFTECGIYSVYMADWQYLHYVWLPEVSTCDICLTCNGTDVVMFVQYCTAQCKLSADMDICLDSKKCGRTRHAGSSTSTCSMWQAVVVNVVHIENIIVLLLIMAIMSQCLVDDDK